MPQLSLSSFQLTIVINFIVAAVVANLPFTVLVARAFLGGGLAQMGSVGKSGDFCYTILSKTPP